ncbi:MAG: hypothetical protein HRT69_18705 [Flavobacteriaceae bacterium]|nr:hypothetical protein [Flavobacteriaceae bacterium]
MAKNTTIGGLSILLGLFIIGITSCNFLPSFFIVFGAIFTIGGGALIAVKKDK